jgi:hypothetical protein
MASASSVAMVAREIKVKPIEDRAGSIAAEILQAASLSRIT